MRPIFVNSFLYKCLLSGSSDSFLKVMFSKPSNNQKTELEFLISLVNILFKNSKNDLEVPTGTLLELCQKDFSLPNLILLRDSVYRYIAEKQEGVSSNDNLSFEIVPISLQELVSGLSRKNHAIYLGNHGVFYFAPISSDGKLFTNSQEKFLVSRYIDFSLMELIKSLGVLDSLSYKERTIQIKNGSSLNIEMLNKASLKMKIQLLT